MTEFIDTIENFKKFIRLASLPGSDAESGGVLFDELSFTIKADGTLVRLSNTNRSGAAIVFYKPKKVVKKGVFWCANTEELLNYLKSIKEGEVTISCSPEKIIIKSDSTKIEMKNCAQEDITTTEFADLATKGFKKLDGNIAQTGETTQLRIHVKADVSKFQKVVSNSKIIKSSVYYPFSVADGILSVKAATHDTSITEIIGKVDGFDPQIHGSIFTNDYLVGFDNIFKNLSGEIDLYFDAARPILVFADQDGMEVTYMLVPYQPEEGEDSDEEEEGEEQDEVEQ